MKKISVFLAVMLIVPFVANGQATSTEDGSNESVYYRRDRIRGWRGQSSEIQQKINSLSTTAVLSIPIPILFGVGIKNISPNFGDPRDGGSRTHEGEDIMAVKGTPIVSPTQAVVLRTGVGATEGNYVYTANPGGETFVYMHLDRIGEGVVSGALIETGGLLGYVGNTGNASGGAAHLHFEVHNSSRDAVDPFPRLSKEFTAEEKISYLSKILTQTNDAVGLSSFLATNFRTVFLSIQNQNIILPDSILNALQNSGSSVSGRSTVTTNSLPAGDLDIGSRGVLVTNLQKYLISKGAGAEALKLKESGATGYFGRLTQSALAEYQLAMRIIPANGYYGPKTRAHVLSGTTNTTSTAGASSLTLTRNLDFGMRGEDVRSLQKFLNSHGFLVAQSGDGSLGKETTYFGKATESAVIKFQLANNISPSLGYVGSLTRARIATK